jgi:hypothetical protein
MLQVVLVYQALGLSFGKRTIAATSKKENTKKKESKFSCFVGSAHGQNGLRPRRTVLMCVPVIVLFSYVLFILCKYAFIKDYVRYWLLWTWE